MEAIGISGSVCSGSEGSAFGAPLSFDDSTLAGRFGEVGSSWPKKVHFLGVDLRAGGLPGVGGCVGSKSNGLELCRRGLGSSGAENEDEVKSSLADAVFGRVPVVLWVAEGLLQLSLNGLDIETIEDKLPAVEWPALIVASEDSLDTTETGRGMTSISSAKRSCRESWPAAGDTGADSARCTLSGLRMREISETEIAAERRCW